MSVLCLTCPNAVGLLVFRESEYWRLVGPWIRKTALYMHMLKLPYTSAKYRYTEEFRCRSMVVRILDLDCIDNH
jgi:hypothetical protein